MAMTEIEPMGDSPAPATVRLCVQYIEGLIAAGWDRDVARETVEASLASASDELERDPVEQLCRYLDDDDNGFRDRFRAACEAYESELTFDNVVAYFADEAEIPPSALADVHNALLDAMIMGAMEERGISPH